MIDAFFDYWLPSIATECRRIIRGPEAAAKLYQEVVSKDGVSRPTDKVGIETYVRAAIPSVRWRYDDLNPLAHHDPLRYSDWKPVVEEAEVEALFAKSAPGRPLFVQVSKAGITRSQKKVAESSAALEFVRPFLPTATAEIKSKTTTENALLSLMSLSRIRWRYDDVNPLAKRNPLRYSNWTPLAFGMAEELLNFADEKRPIFLQIVRENTFSSEVFTDKNAAVAFVRDHDESRRLRN